MSQSPNEVFEITPNHETPNIVMCIKVLFLVRCNDTFIIGETSTKCRLSVNFYDKFSTIENHFIYFFRQRIHLILMRYRKLSS